jgi:hypothetical protein
VNARVGKEVPVIPILLEKPTVASWARPRDKAMSRIHAERQADHKQNNEDARKMNQEKA